MSHGKLGTDGTFPLSGAGSIPSDGDLVPKTRKLGTDGTFPLSGAGSIPSDGDLVPETRTKLICLVHILMDPSGLPVAALVVILWLLTFYRVRSAFAGIFQQRVPEQA